MALAGTKPTGSSVSAPGTGNSVLMGEAAPPPQISFSDVLKGIGWQGYLLIAVVAALYGPILFRLYGQWMADPDYSHGILVPFVTLYFIWRKRDDLAKVPSQPSFWGLVVVLGSLGVLVLGSLGAELSLARGSIIGVICGLIIYFGGWAKLRTIAFPIAFLLFCIPLPRLFYNEIVFPLQFVASGFATRVLEILNIFPIMREGNVLVMPGLRLEVVEACSGIRSLISLLALAAGYGYLAEKSNTVRWFMFLAMVPLAIISNGTRVMITALMAHYIGPQAAEGFMHEFSGWVIFVVATVLFLALHSLTVRIRKKLGWLPPDPPAKPPQEAVA
ncbi:MAG: exosortase/archaeosortase family protein [Candidatus Korobacteraceae bacterium]